MAITVERHQAICRPTKVFFFCVMIMTNISRNCTSNPHITKSSKTGRLLLWLFSSFVLQKDEFPCPSNITSVCLSLLIQSALALLRTDLRLFCRNIFLCCISRYLYTRLLHISACRSICPYTVWKNVMLNHFGWIFSIGSASTHRIPEQSLPCIFYPPWPWHSFSTYQGSHSHQHIKVIIVLNSF